MENNTVKIILSISWCLLTYIISVSKDPGIGTAIILAILLLIANIYYYINRKCNIQLSITVKLFSFITLLIYSILITGLFRKLFPISTMYYLNTYNNIAAKMYMFISDIIIMLCTMMLLSPLLIYIYKDRYKIIVILLSVLLIIYPLQFNSITSMYATIAIVSANILGSLFAICFTAWIVRKDILPFYSNKRE